MACNAFRRDDTNLSNTVERLLPLPDGPVQKGRRV
jgi:hypothetical protein